MDLLALHTPWKRSPCALWTYGQIAARLKRRGSSTPSDVKYDVASQCWSSIRERSLGLFSARSATTLAPVTALLAVADRLDAEQKKGSLILWIRPSLLSGCPARWLLEQRHHGFGRTRFDPRASFDVQLRDNTVINEHGIALTSHTHTKSSCVESKPHSLGKFTVAVSYH